MPERAAEQPSQKIPVPRPLRALRWVLVALLFVSALLTLFGVPELREEVAAGRWPKATLAAPPVILAVFVVGYAVYRVKLVRLGRYEPGRALVRIALLSLALAVIAGLVLFPGDEVRRPVDLAAALRSSDATTKALAAEVARHRPSAEARPLLPALVRLLEDPSPEVRRQAHASLVVLVGADLGTAAEGWRARLGAP